MGPFAGRSHLGRQGPILWNSLPPHFLYTASPSKHGGSLLGSGGGEGMRNPPYFL